VLDEPNSNLDGEGEAALTSAIEAIKARGGIVVVIAHRPSALAAVDLIAVIQNGRMTTFGPKEEIIGNAPRREAHSPEAQPRKETLAGVSARVSASSTSEARRRKRKKPIPPIGTS